MSPKVFTVIGLLFDLVGAVVIAWGLMITKQQADDLAATYYDSNPFVSSSLLGQKKKAIAGLILLVFGAAFQIVGTLTQ